MNKCFRLMKSAAILAVLLAPCTFLSLGLSAKDKEPVRHWYFEKSKLDSDGIPELWLRTEDEDGAFFCMGGDAPQLIATENWKIKGNICQHGVLVAGSAGTGAFYAHYVLLENSRVVDNIHYNATLDINTDEMRVEYSRGDKEISVEEGEKVTARLGEAREVEPVWHQLNIEY